MTVTKLSWRTGVSAVLVVRDFADGAAVGAVVL